MYFVQYITIYRKLNHGPCLALESRICKIAKKRSKPKWMQLEATPVIFGSFIRGDTRHYKLLLSLTLKEISTIQLYRLCCYKYLVIVL